MNRLGIAAMALLAVATAAQANLLTNGDFSAGNTGFTSQYRYAISSTAETTYTVGTDPQLFHFSSDSFGDHTSGNGHMLIANGAVDANRYIWEQSVTLSENTNYVFSGWVSSWGNFGDSTDPSPSELIFLVNGVQIDTSANVPATNRQWSQFQFVWNSGSSTSATLRLVDINTAPVGNDFAIDDLRLASIPEPSSGLLLGAGLLAATLLRRSRDS